MELEDLEPEPIQQYKLGRLQQFLEYEISTAVLFVLAVFFPVINLLIMGAAAALFTPYLLYVLWGEGRYGWIAFFLILVILPAFVIYEKFSGTNYLVPLSVIPLVLFYGYCATLRFVIREWFSS